MSSSNTETKGNNLGKKGINRILLFGTVLGTLGGIVRGVQLLDFDAKKLPETAGGIHVALWAVLAAELCVTVLVWFLIRKKTVKGHAGRSGMVEHLFPSVAMVIFALCAAIRLSLSYKPFSAWGIFLSIVCFAVAAATPLTVKSLGTSAPSEGEKLISLLPVGCMVVTIIEIYRSVAKTPSASFYATDVFAAVALILLFFAVAGAVNGKTGAKKVIVFALASVQIGMTAFIGRIICVLAGVLNGGSFSAVLSHEFFEGLLALGGVVFAFAAANAAQRVGERTPNTESKETETLTETK